MSEIVSGYLAIFLAHLFVQLGKRKNREPVKGAKRWELLRRDKKER